MTEPGSILIHHAGVTTWQDSGRHGWRAIGVPTSGPLHQQRYTHLTQLLTPTTIPTPTPTPTTTTTAQPLAVWENLTGDIHFTLTPPPGTPTVLAAITGPANLLTVTDPGTSGYLALTANSTALLPAGTYHLHRTPTPGNPSNHGPVYLTIHGWQPPTPVLGSVATDTHSRLGPPPLTPGTRIPLHPTHNNTHTQPGAFTPPTTTNHSPNTQPLTFHPHWDAGAHYLHATTWTIHTYARNGIRLNTHPHSTPPNAPEHPTLDSFPVLPGIIQLPPDGNPIVLGPDSGTMGGYPTIGWLPPHALDTLTTRTPGAPLHFTPTPWDNHTTPGAPATAPDNHASHLNHITHPDTLTTQQPAWA